MIPTPDLSHLKRQDYDHVYEPAGMCSMVFTTLSCCSSYARLGKVGMNPEVFLLNRGHILVPGRIRGGGAILERSSTDHFIRDRVRSQRLHDVGDFANETGY